MRANRDRERHEQRPISKNPGTETYGRGAGVGRGLGVGANLGVGLAVAVGVAVAVEVGVAVTVGVGVGVGVGVACTSKEPMSIRPFTTRSNPDPR